MYNITIHYYKELNFFLPPARRDTDIHFPFTGRRSVKDLIESMGIPHVEVDLVLVNGVSSGFSYIVSDGDIIRVYPANEFPERNDFLRLSISPLIDTKFVLDVHLRKLARSMRLMGFDVDYTDDRDDDVLADISHRGNRILLTCDRQLLMRKIVSRGYIIRSRDPSVQIIEVIQRLNLQDMIKPFTRCIECNGIIERIDINSPESDTVKRSIPEGVISWCSEYFRCTECHKVYWKGSHYDRLSEKLRRMMSKLDNGSTVRQ